MHSRLNATCVIGLDSKVAISFVHINSLKLYPVSQPEHTVGGTSSWSALRALVAAKITTST